MKQDITQGLNTEDKKTNSGWVMLKKIIKNKINMNNLKANRLIKRK